MPRGTLKSVAAVDKPGPSSSSRAKRVRMKGKADTEHGETSAAVQAEQARAESTPLTVQKPSEVSSANDDEALADEQWPPSSSTMMDDVPDQIDELSVQMYKLIKTVLAREGAGVESLTPTQRRPYLPQKKVNGRGFQCCYMGALESQTRQILEAHTSQSLARLNGDDGKPGAMLNAGGHIYSLDWLTTSHVSPLQYFCVSASLEENPKTVIGEESSRGGAGIQIWSVREQWSQTRLELVLCCEQGRISSLRWVPIASSSSHSSSGHGLDTSILGVLSACMQDGTVAIFAVPAPDSIANAEGADSIVPYLRLKPLIHLDVKKGEPIVQEWHNANTLAVGYSDGWLSTWDLSHCLQVGTRRARPDTYSKVASSPISSLAWHPNGQQVYVAAYDGAARCVQLAHPHLNTTLYHSRDISYALAYDYTADTLLMERPELNDVRDVAFVEGKAASTTLHSHLGRVRVLTTSSFHSLIASGGVDGSVRVVDSREMTTTSGKGSRRSKDRVTIVYRLDRHRGTQDLRMIDNLAKVPTVYQTQHAMAATAAWDPSISLTALRWNPNAVKGNWLLSGLACGLIRIDIVQVS